MADTHFSVEKGSETAAPHTRVVLLTGSGGRRSWPDHRGGSRVTEALLASAGELLTRRSAIGAN